ncbi:pimeloyl-ACP methyl ester carboxylesterase [Halanaerobium saccharolyticum]|uniref:Pimeloyl-ACP methyl ester carboxylesterase n=1 Tax=Halanaerobium saccharolyticum TaxID=43595 RepID=A0A4R7YUA9_9FIRM|nr:alpha/beta hydrolase [Halanaerobium saccharolyticum]RAK10238.1 pimeloyl-ACP methyl ester carboxylesterase [Halanaerobium saccharolyticum]TDW00450.1 pimeloyl-ACP methyl ester carboxylesterase [Halanaerobium saccharolyticum]TDX52035.1 pimeloyl-ACP methyl ester carboxylesterase [Halanaerobium saccharolyticum]
MLKKMLFFIIFFVLFVSVNTYAIGNGLIIKEKKVENPKGESLIYYLGMREENSLSNTLFIGIQGSQRDSNKRFDFWSDFAPENADLLLLEKYAFYNKKLYNKTNCRQRRIKDIEFVVKYVLNNIYNNNLKNIVLFGGSEGGVISPEIASNLEEITHMVVIGAGGYSQARELDILLKQEINSEEERLLEKIGIRNKEDLQNKFDEIRNNPSPDKFWFGCTYKKWNSYLDYSPEEYITDLDIPLLFIIGKKDKMVPYQSVEYLAKKLRDKVNFRFEILPGLNHSFTDKDGNNKMNYIIEQIIFPWYRENGI